MTVVLVLYIDTVVNFFFDWYLVKRQLRERYGTKENDNKTEKIL